MVNYLATFSSDKPTSITLNNGGGTVNIDTVLDFSGGNTPSIDDISTTEGSVIYLDISASIAADIINYISVYNNWSYSIAKYTNLSFVFYIKPDTGSTTDTISIDNICKAFEYTYNAYCPYNDISFDIPNAFKEKITSITFWYINNSTFDVSGFSNLTTLILRNCFNLETILGINNISENTNELENIIKLTTLDLSSCPKLKGYIMDNIPLITTLTKLVLNCCDLDELPLDKMKNDKITYMSARYNNFGGTLDFLNFPTTIEHLNLEGNNYTDINFIKTTPHDKIAYGCLVGNLSYLGIDNNQIKSLYVDFESSDIKRTININSNNLENLMLYNIKNNNIYSQFCKLNHVYIDGKYFDKCSEIKKYINVDGYNGKFYIFNNYLHMDEQDLNENDILVNPQFYGDKISYDPYTIIYTTENDKVILPTSVLYDGITDPNFYIIQRSRDVNIDFNNIFNYCEGYDDEYIRQQILFYNYKDCVLNIYNAQNLLNNPESTLYKAFTFAKGYFKLKGIRTNTPSIGNFFPGVPIIFTNDPSEIPSIFSINLITE